MVRYIYFLLRFRQWFKNENGIKRFSEQCMLWLQNNTLRFTEKLENQNKKLQSSCAAFRAEITRRQFKPVILEDEFPAIAAMLKKFILFVIICIIAELTLNFFVSKACITFPGYLAFILQILLAAIFTGASIILFESLFEQIFHELPYKAEHREPRKPLRLITLIILASIYQIMMFYFCQIRGAEIEGSAGNGVITIALTIGGMIIPVIAGYCAYEISRYISAYKNTKGVIKAEKQLKENETRIEQNKVRLEKTYKEMCEDKWAVNSEFRTYKEVYNKRHGLPLEYLEEHFCRSQEEFMKQADSRFYRMVIKTEAITPDIIFIPERKTLKRKIINTRTKTLTMILATCMFLALSACNTATKRRNVIVQIDNSGSVSAERLRKYLWLIEDMLLDQIGPGDRLTVFFLDRCSMSKAERIYSIDFSRIDFNRKEDGKNHEADSINRRFKHFITDSIRPELTRVIKQKREERKDCAGLTDIIRGLKEAESRLIENVTLSKTDAFLNGLFGKEQVYYENCLILLSDMVNEDIEKEFDFTHITDMTEAQIRKKATSLDSTLLPTLRNTSVFIYGSTSTNQGKDMNKQIENTKLFWKLYFERSHAELKAYGYDIKDEIIDYFRE